MTGLVGNTIPSAAVAGDSVIVAAGENRMKPDADATSRSNCKLTLGGKDGYAVAWQAKKVASGTASPVAYAGHVYFTDKSGFVVCLDDKTGEERYRERLDNLQWATPIAAGEHLYFFGKDGTTTVLKAGPEFDKVASNKLWSDADAAKRKEEAKKKAEATLPKPPEGRGPGGGPPLPKPELDATRYSAVGDVVYGAAAVDGAFYIRTGTELVCIRK
jgi:outer membrane protein assembly factor BamB